MNNSEASLFQKFSHFYDPYSQEIKQHYFSKPQTNKLDQPFVTMHSDYLNLQVKADKSVWSKSTYYEGDIILQVRGFYVYENELKINLQKIGKNIGYYDGCYGVLLWLDRINKILIKPKGITQILIKDSIKESKKKQNKVKGNCYIEEHYGSKILIKAGQIIPKQQKLVIVQEQLDKWLYK